MGYDFYCTKCGKKHDQSTVLFDMNLILLEDVNYTPNFLKFYMTLDELTDLATPDKGESVDEEGYTHCSFSYEQIMEYLSSEKCTGVKDLKELTLDEIKTFAEWEKYSSEEAGSSDVEENLNFDLDFDLEVEKKTDASQESDPPAIKELIKTSKINSNLRIDRENLKEEFRNTILQMFSEKQQHVFRIKLKPSPNDSSLTIGYLINNHITKEEQRVCSSSKCHFPFFEEAGTAEHRVVSFIGPTSSGKTSTILALTHYAYYGLVKMGENDDTRVWSRPGVNTYRNTSLTPFKVKVERRLTEDLCWFSYGAAPPKTNATKKDDAYHSTICFVDNSTKRKIILTLIDLPGELFNDGRVNETILGDLFSAAMSSMAFIICFDYNTATMNEITELIRMSTQMQSICQARRGDNYYIPSMVLFTHADNTSDAAGIHVEPDDIYMFANESKVMQDDQRYVQIVQNFNNGQLKNAFYSVLRCGAFGHYVPTSEDIQKAVSMHSDFTWENEQSNTGDNLGHGGEETDLKIKIKKVFLPMFMDIINKGLDGEEIYSYSKGGPTAVLVDKYRDIAEKDPQFKLDMQSMRPTPNNIDTLMRWILTISGCLSIEGKYDPPNTDAYCELEPYFLEKTQYRTMNPGHNRKDGDLRDALARNMLFVNPGKWDKELLRADKTPGTFLKKFFDGHIDNVRKRMKKSNDNSN